jgi:hypothetical protein
MPSFGTAWTYEQESVKCGRPSCRSCPHGPYWYRYKREGKNVKKEYVGRELPFTPPSDPPRRPGQIDPVDEMLRVDGNHDLAAHMLLDLGQRCEYLTARAAYRKACRDQHPDRGGSERRMQAVDAAWRYVRRVYGF